MGAEKILQQIKKIKGAFTSKGKDITKQEEKLNNLLEKIKIEKKESKLNLPKVNKDSQKKKIKNNIKKLNDAEKQVKKNKKILLGGTVVTGVGTGIALLKSDSYKIKQGDTLSEIARDRGTTLGKLKSANPQIKDLNAIKPGDVIKIPGKVKNRKSVYQDVDMSKITMKKRAGGPLQNIPAGNKGLPNLPTPVRNKMGFKKRGGAVVKRAVGGGVALRGLGAVRKV